MFRVTATKGNEMVSKLYGMYFQALTAALQFQNSGYEVEVVRE